MTLNNSIVFLPNSHWLFAKNTLSNFKSDTLHHSTGKFITYVNFKDTTTQEREDFFKFCVYYLDKTHPFVSGKIRYKPNVVHKIPILFYALTINKNIIKQELSKLKTELKQHPLYSVWLEQKIINFHFYWKLDTQTFSESKLKQK